MQTFESLLKKHGYAEVAIARLAEQTIAPQGCDGELVERYLNAIIGNYYMQYLALKLNEYGFDLNRPNLSAQELNKADSLITGKMGNVPFDNAYVVQFLEFMVVALRKAHEIEPLTWRHLFHFTYIASDETSLQGSELIKALIRSDRIYSGQQAVHYRHRFLGLSFRTVSMKELMAYVLPDVPHEDLHNVNRYGRTVQAIAIDQVKNIIRAIAHLETPKFNEFFSVSTHHRIMQCIKEINMLVQKSPVDLTAIVSLYERFKNERYTRGVYPENWQRFISELESALEMIATPYQPKNSPAPINKATTETDTISEAPTSPAGATYHASSGLH